MAFFYNPDLMSEADIKATFVARQSLVDKLVNLIELQPDGKGIQHVIINAPRGMGKTTVLLMIQFSAKDGGISEQWQVVRFPEERYNIYDLSDFWLEILRHLAEETNDNKFQEQIEKLHSEYPNNDDLQEVAYSLIKDWRRKNGKRIVVLVDNFDQILDQINDERDNARLRDILLNDGTILLIGGATTFFQEGRVHDQPLYNLFKIENLDDLSFEQMEELLMRRAEIDGRENFAETLQKNNSRLRALKHFTGGNPRLVLMLYDVIAKSNITDVRNALEKLLDEVTPYFKAKVELLPAQQRKIIDYIASISSETNEGLTPTEIAVATRMTSNQASSQLKRLNENGYVRAANVRGRSSFYTLSEPLFAIWHQMRSGRSARERRGWLVSILRALYDTQSVNAEQNKLNERFLDYIRDGRLSEAKDTLEHKLCLTEATIGSNRSKSEVESIISCYLELKDFDTLKNELTQDLLKHLSVETLKKLLESGCINQKQFDEARIQTSLPKREQTRAEAKAAYMLGMLSSSKNESDELTLSHFERATELNPNHHQGWIGRGIALCRLKRFKEGLSSFENAIRIGENCYSSWLCKGDALKDLKQYEEAVTSYQKAIQIDPSIHDAWCHQNNVLFDLKRYEDVIAGCEKLIEINSKDECAWANKGLAFARLGNYEKAFENYDHAVQLDPNDYRKWVNRSLALDQIGRHKDAIDSYDHAIRIDENEKRAWYGKGISYAKEVKRLVADNCIAEAETSLNEAIKSLQRAKAENWLEIIATDILEVTTSERLQVIRSLIQSAKLEEPLFPILRAIDYLETDNEVLIEKLSPEVRGLVEKIIAQLRESSKQSNNKLNRKSQNGSSNKKLNSRSVSQSKRNRKF